MCKCFLTILGFCLWSSSAMAWLDESHEFARQFAYAEPLSTGKHVVELTRKYETDAQRVAEVQISLAAARLASLINSAFK